MLTGGLKSVDFCLREVNDIDHITPLIDYVCLKGRVKVRLILVSKHFGELVSNPNINYIRKKYNIEIVNFWREIESRKIAFFLTVLSDKMRDIISFLKREDAVLYLVFGVFLVWASNFVWYICYRTMRRAFLKMGEIPEISFLDVGSNTNYPYRLLHLIYQSFSIDRVGLSHGINVFIEEDYTVKHKIIKGKDGVIKKGFVSFYRKMIKKKPLYMDYYLVPCGQESYYCGLAAGFIPKDRLVEVGSMRFSREWNQKYRKDIFPDVMRRDDDGLNIVIFLIFEKYNVQKSELIEAINVLGSFDGVSVKIKPFTRGNIIDAGIRKIADNYESVEIDCSDSPNLISWCDVAVAYGSSIEYQVLLDQKILLHLTYINGNRTIFHEYNCLHDVSSLDELSDIVNRIVYGDLVMYSSDNVESLIADTVMCGNDGYIASKYVEEVYKRSGVDLR